MYILGHPADLEWPSRHCETTCSRRQNSRKKIKERLILNLDYGCYEVKQKRMWCSHGSLPNEMLPLALRGFFSQNK